MAYREQDRDQFDDLITMRHNTIVENQDNPQVNKFNIMDFTPREKSPAGSVVKKRNQSQMRKKAAIKGLDDDDDEDNFDEFLADFEKKKKEKDDSQMTEMKLHEIEKTNLEAEIKTLIKIKDTQSPEGSASSKSSRALGKRKPPRRKAAHNN